MQSRVDTITVAVDDLKRSLAFYQDAFGWQPRWPTENDIDSADHAAFELQGGVSFVLYFRTALAQDVEEYNARPSSAEFILTHTVGSKEAVDQVLQRANAAGAVLLGHPFDASWGYSGKFKDVDGHVWEILWNSTIEN